MRCAVVRASQPVAADRLARRTSGVLPMAPSTPSPPPGSVAVAHESAPHESCSAHASHVAAAAAQRRHRSGARGAPATAMRWRPRRRLLLRAAGVPCPRALSCRALRRCASPHMARAARCAALMRAAARWQPSGRSSFEFGTIFASHFPRAPRRARTPMFTPQAAATHAPPLRTAAAPAALRAQHLRRQAPASARRAPEAPTPQQTQR
jgi:hypothetical protein